MVKVKTGLTYLERQRLFGQLLEYSKSVNDLNWYPLLGYGNQLVGPDELYIYACTPETSQVNTKELLKEIHVGLLFFSTNRERDIVINEIIKPHNQSKGRISAKVKSNLAIFDKLCTEHPLYSRLFPNGRKSLISDL